ncbi:2Fe-2S iron-sulfur cluster-binding protein [Mycoplana ramosa]|uniref:2Fe-2S iron-sulfur cluster-binding protein n=1 Tax=Mycoplana ramosa TaxID=40837 RepID=A0ABW3YY42_MYCRA
MKRLQRQSRHPEGFLVTLPLARSSIRAAPDQTLLAAALAAGVDYPHGCKSGRCGSCKSRLASGSVTMLPHSRFSLTDEEKAAGLILACRAVPQSDVTVMWSRGDAEAGHRRKQVEGIVTSVSSATHDILKVHVTLGGEDFRFSAGQYVKLTVGKRLVRDYSIASVPGGRELEFHVRKVPNGLVSSHIHEELWVGDKVMVEGPFGDAHLRSLHTGPILAVAGGSGLAPIRSIVETALSSGMRQPIRLYFGVREERDAYDVDLLDRLAGDHPNFSYQVVTSRSDSARFRVGHVSAAIDADLCLLEGWKAYVAGPPAMVEAVAEGVFAAGLGTDDFHADVFFTPEAIAD